MKFVSILKVLTLLQCIVASQNSVVQEAKRHIRAEVRSALDLPLYYRANSPRTSTTIHRSHHGQQRQHAHAQPHQYHHHHHHHQHRQQQHRVHGHPQRWSDRRARGWHSMERHHFTGWSAWSVCGGHDCIKRRERLCRLKRKCGHTKHVEERKCWGCEPAQPSFIHHQSVDALPAVWTATSTTPAVQQPPQSIIINAAAAAAIGGGPPTQAAAVTARPAQTISHDDEPHYEEEQSEEEVNEEEDNESDFFVINRRPKWQRQPPPPLTIGSDYAGHEHKEWAVQRDYKHNESTFVYVRPSRSQHQKTTVLRNLRPSQRQRKQGRGRLRQANNADDGIDGDVFQYEDFDFETERGSVESQYNDSDEEFEVEAAAVGRNSSVPAKEKATPDALIPRHRRVYSKWSRWTKCSPKCTTRRYKKCRIKEQCGREVLREIAYCYTEGSFCQQWLQAQMQKTPPYELRPVAAARRRDISYGGGGGIGGGGSQSNSIVSDYIMNGKGYRGPEYAPMKLKCGIAGIRSGKRNMYNMLKIIGGKPARKGEWPWQVAIINRFKEAFCGGTLIAPQWVLTAAHCVRKVLYVRIGEHNLDYEDGTELQMRVLKSFKHPNFDKKTVDSDVALLKLPKPVNATSWIGFSCLPRPYQPLPKSVDCTVIGWGKRRNRDVAGTSVLHQAEVPIIPMENCRSVYHDYTITKNMFCAGHKRGRIDTCAGDSGGPLLCRDSTKPNHPWTIFGITSFGDGCAKRNKFGIYAKVPNYVDWVWSVINCNGNCKLHQRAYE